MSNAARRIRYEPAGIPPEMFDAWKRVQSVVIRKFMRDENRSDAEDYWQISWVAVLKIWRKGYRGDSLRRIATNQAIGEWTNTYGNRSKWIGQTTADDLGTIAFVREPDEREENPAADLDQRFWRHLSPTQRAVLETVVIDGMDHAGAAEKLGLTPLTVRTVVCRAKQRLRVMAS